jgi:hypothetical protein
MAAEDLLPSKAIQLTGPDGKVVEIQAEIADEPAEQQRGLMFRESLPPGFGMLFVFDQEQPLGFWMKNTLIPLDIMYFDADGKLVSSTTMVPCEADPCMSYPSEGNAKFALEVEEGFNQAQGIGGEWQLVY